jgi:predicted O-methyltransferase YrrM
MATLRTRDRGASAAPEPPGAASIYLDTLTPQAIAVGYGGLGRGGQLGYEGRRVRVQGRRYPHALSTHPPARLSYHLGGRFARFTCAVALNDDVAPDSTHADFSVLADGRPVATIPQVRPGDAPQPLAVDLSGVQCLELVVQTSRWDCCHAVWLDPRLIRQPVTGGGTLRDCLGRAAITLPTSLPRAERCVATIASAQFAGLLDDMLGSFYANGGCPDALVVVFGLDADPECARVAARYGATFIPCARQARLDITVKSVLYSVARVVEARQYLCLDADMLVLGDLGPLFGALDACPSGSILACAEGNERHAGTLEEGLYRIYGGGPGDLARLLGTPDGEGAYPLLVNDGLFAGSRAALLALDATIRALPEAAAWTDERPDIWWRNQFVFNLALARLRCGVELDPTYNVQLHVQDVALRRAAGRIAAEWRGQAVRVLHFSGRGRQKYPAWRGLFAGGDAPLTGSGGGDGYAAFLAALRAWVGQHGRAALAWSFYGTTDGRSARVPDPATLPLLALLHYLVRANGCCRVFETGTARGVTAACLASAVAHRPGGQVVTFDPAPAAARLDLWAALPPAMRRCIEERPVDALAGLAAARAAGERYEAALLDSVHTAEHVWAEFELAAQLVCPGGLILIHDAQYAYGTVAQALDRIAAAGYGVVRLWTADAGVAEDDRLGLAVVENRRR